MNWEEFDPRRKLVATYGRFTVHHDPIVHLPWGLYRVYAGQRYIGAQISFPSKSDCEWLAQGAVFAIESGPTYQGAYRINYKRGATSSGYLRWRREKRAA